MTFCSGHEMKQYNQGSDWKCNKNFINILFPDMANIYTLQFYMGPSY